MGGNSSQKMMIHLPSGNELLVSAILDLFDTIIHMRVHYVLSMDGTHARQSRWWQKHTRITSTIAALCIRSHEIETILLNTMPLLTWLFWNVCNCREQLLLVTVVSHQLPWRQSRVLSVPPFSIRLPWSWPQRSRRGSWRTSRLPK